MWDKKLIIDWELEETEENSDKADEEEDVTEQAPVLPH